MDSKALDCPTLSAKDRDEGERRVILIGDSERAYFRWCRPDTFMMGSPENEEGRRDDETQHEVKLTKGFWIMETPVTVGMFNTFLSDEDYNPKAKSPYILRLGHRSKRDPNVSWCDSSEDITGNINWPATCIFWDDAEAFCQWLSDKKGLKMRLPTEAQWEYACRAGRTQEPTLEELNEMAWLPTNSGGKIHPVAEKKPNAWGIYDMLGNVWEWCRDWYEAFSNMSVTDPTGPEDGTCRVIRGGSWASDNDQRCRLASRYGYWCLDNPRKYSSNYVGFRVVCECEQQQKIVTNRRATGVNPWVQHRQPMSSVSPGTNVPGSPITPNS